MARRANKSAWHYNRILFYNKSNHNRFYGDINEGVEMNDKLFTTIELLLLLNEEGNLGSQAFREHLTKKIVEIVNCYQEEKENDLH